MRPEDAWRGRCVAIAALLALGGCRKSDEAFMTSLRPGPVLYVARKIWTMDPSRPFAEALAVSGGRIVAVGARRDVEAAVGEATVVELPNATVVPGLHDAHGHLRALGNSLSLVSLNGAASVDEVVWRMKQGAKTSLQGEWLLGRGWDQNDWPLQRGDFPDKAALDAAFPDLPVLLTRIDGHAGWLNSVGLSRAGIDARTPDPVGGRILRDARGEPTGILVDNALDLVTRKLPPLSDEQLALRLEKAFARCAEVGISAVHDAGMDLRTFQLLQQWDLLDRLPLRVYAMADGQSGPDVQAYLERGVFQGRMLTMRAVKLLADGALGSRGAALHAPYSDDPSQSGLLLIEPRTLHQRAHDFMARGFQVAIHAIGDRANTLVLDVLAQQAEATGTQALRHRVEHAQVLRLEDIPRFAQHGIIASMQPTHATSDLPWAAARLGEERLRGAYAWKRLLKAGAVLAFGSDFPIEDSDPLQGLYAARTRMDALGRPAGGWFPEERLTGEEALRAFTVGAAYASHAETRRGMLREGMDADFVALDTDPVDDAPQRVARARVLVSVVAGRLTHRAPAAAGLAVSP